MLWRCWSATVFSGEQVACVCVCVHSLRVQPKKCMCVEGGVGWGEGEYFFSRFHRHRGLYPCTVRQAEEGTGSTNGKGGGVRVLVGYGSPILALAYQLRVTDRPNAIALWGEGRRLVGEIKCWSFAACSRLIHWKWVISTPRRKLSPAVWGTPHTGKWENKEVRYRSWRARLQEVSQAGLASFYNSPSKQWFSFYGKKIPVKKGTSRLFLLNPSHK